MQNKLRRQTCYLTIIQPHENECVAAHVCGPQCGPYRAEEKGEIPRLIFDPDRATHAERAIFEKLTEFLDSIENPKGTVRVTISYESCPACEDLAKQFVERFPDVELTLELGPPSPAKQKWLDKQFD